MAGKGLERPGRDWRGREGTGEAGKGLERPRRDWRGREGTGEAGKGLERPGRAWRGREGTGEAGKGLERPGWQLVPALLPLPLPPLLPAPSPWHLFPCLPQSLGSGLIPLPFPALLSVPCFFAGRGSAQAVSSKNTINHSCSIPDSKKLTFSEVLSLVYISDDSVVCEHKKYSYNINHHQSAKLTVGPRPEASRFDAGPLELYINHHQCEFENRQLRKTCNTLLLANTDIFR